MQERSRQLRQAMQRSAREIEGLAVEGGQREKRGKVRARPLPVHVRLSGAGVAVHHDSQRRGPVVDSYLGPSIGGTVAEDVAPSVRFDNRQAADPDARGHRESRSPGGGFEDWHSGKDGHSGEAASFGLSGGRTNSGAHRTVSGSGVAEAWRWKIAPLSHSRSACQ
jgi:hypothetical protein